MQRLVDSSSVDGFGVASLPGTCFGQEDNYKGKSSSLRSELRNAKANA